VKVVHVALTVAVRFDKGPPLALTITGRGVSAAEAYAEARNAAEAEIPRWVETIGGDGKAARQP
jgi:hypothetical protein